SLNDTDRAVRANQALTRVVNAESKYFQANGKYAGHVADLVPLAPKLAIDLTDGLVTIQIDSSGDKSYLVQVASTVVSFTREFKNSVTKDDHHQPAELTASAVEEPVRAPASTSKRELDSI